MFIVVVLSWLIKKNNDFVYGELTKINHNLRSNKNVWGNILKFRNDKHMFSKIEMKVECIGYCVFLAWKLANQKLGLYREISWLK